jgi:exopolyphosphatase/guanosine-5'-triphosphate,3'-diphosphate pyrophosphatase
MRRVAAFDCGTNSLRLLIADIDAESGVASDVVRRTQIVRLGQDVDRTGRFADEALARTFAVVDEYAREVESAQPGAIGFVATSAARDVANRDEFTSGVQQRLGIQPAIISGEEEARLAYDGATRGLDAFAELARPLVVLDIGGGSTELVTRIGDNGPVQGQSLDIGSVRMTERHLAGDPPSSNEIAAADADIQRALDSLELDLADVGTLVGVAGSITTMVAMALDLSEYDRERIHHAWVDRDAIDASVSRILTMSVDERRALGFMAPGRADVIAGGALVLRAVMHRLGVPGLRASEHDILDGIAWSLA